MTSPVCDGVLIWNGLVAQPPRLAGREVPIACDERRCRPAAELPATASRPAGMVEAARAVAGAEAQAGAGREPAAPSRPAASRRRQPLDV